MENKLLATITVTTKETVRKYTDFLNKRKIKYKVVPHNGDHQIKLLASTSELVILNTIIKEGF